jgi:diaminopimelate epimerase
MRVQFTKMHGLGNDFLVIDAVSQHVNLRVSQIQKLADRNTGVGFDQLLLIEPPSRPDADFDYRIFNSDGGEVEHCGNGARCFAKFVTDRGLISKPVMSVNTARGLIELMVTDLGLVRVNMGRPVFDPKALPYAAPPEPDASQTVALETPFGQKKFGLISMGNPHAVCIVDSIDSIEVEDIGRAVQMLPQFPNSVNVGFIEIISRTEIRLRVYERGAGETLACGTGACAAVTYARSVERLDSQVNVATRCGNLQIEWAGIGHDLIMTGPAESVFEGEFRL